MDPAASKAAFADALSFVPDNVDQMDYIDWDALGHPKEDFFSVIDDEMTEKWSQRLGVAPHSEQWSAGFGTSTTPNGVILHWRDPRPVVSVVAALESYGWRSSGPASATRLTYPGPQNVDAAKYLFLGEVWADTTSGTLIVNAHGEHLLPRPTSPTLSVPRYRPVLDALPQFAAATLHVASLACDRLLVEPSENPLRKKRYRAAVAPFHSVISNAVLLSAATIPDHVHVADPSPITSDVYVQLADSAAAQADLDARAVIGDKVAAIKGQNPGEFTLVAKQRLGSLDHYTVTGFKPLYLGPYFASGFDVCGAG